MRFKKLCKLISKHEYINVYCNGMYIDHGRKKYMKRVYGDREVKAIGSGRFRENDDWITLLHVYLEEKP